MNDALKLAQSEALLTARTLSEALPYLQRYDNQTIVIKYGGHAMVDPELAKAFARDVVLLKLLGIHPVVVHGGGPQIGAMLDKLAIKDTVSLARLATQYGVHDATLSPN
jgi:acetylglutamate kinase